MYGNYSFLSQYGPINGSFSPASMQKFAQGFGQNLAAPGTVNPLPFGGGSSGGGWGPNQFASMPIGQNFGANMGDFNYYGSDFPTFDLSSLGSVTADGRGIASVTSVTPAGGSVSLLQADQTAPEENTSDYNVVTRTLKGTGGISVSESSDEITISTTGTAGGETIADSDTIAPGSGDVTARELDGKYGWTSNSQDFFTNSSGGTFTPRTDAISKFNFGVGRIYNPTRSGTSGFHSYEFERYAGDIDNSGTCFNMLETTVAKGSGIIGGVNTASASYPSDFEPAPVQWSNGPDSAVYQKYSLVFLWRDVDNKLGGGAGRHYFQAMQNHDGECNSE